MMCYSKFEISSSSSSSPSCPFLRRLRQRFAPTLSLSLSIVGNEEANRVESDTPSPKCGGVRVEKR